jgi:hypothetical protein
MFLSAVVLAAPRFATLEDGKSALERWKRGVFDAEGIPVRGEHCGGSAGVRD